MDIPTSHIDPPSITLSERLYALSCPEIAKAAHPYSIACLAEEAAHAIAYLEGSCDGYSLEMQKLENRIFDLEGVLEHVRDTDRMIAEDEFRRTKE